MSKGHVGTVVGEVGDGDGGRTVGEEVVLDLEDLACHVRGGDGDGVEEAETEMEKAAVFLCEVC